MEVKYAWDFQADADIFRLASEAYRISVAHLVEPYLAVHSSRIEPLPHQISAVYERMLPRRPLRFVLADDPGAGKTIMTGLLLKELFICGDVRRCLIVCPGTLTGQWQDELRQKFQLDFEIFHGDKINPSTKFLISSLDRLARNDDIKESLQSTTWDLIVCDEAHKMSATIWGGKIDYTKRFRLGQLLSKITRHFLLLTANCHASQRQGGGFLPVHVAD